MEPRPDSPALLTIPAATKYLSLGRTTMFKLMSDGELAPIKIGRATRLARTELDRWLNAKGVPSPTQALQAQIDALTLRLYGDPDSGGTDGGEIGRLQRDVETLFDEVATMLPRAAAQPHRQTSDEAATYTVATS